MSSPISSPSDDRLLGLTALSATDAWAVGWTIDGTSRPASHPLIEHWNGLRWSLVQDSSPQIQRYLNAVSAVSGQDAWAVGNSMSSADPVIEHWDGHAWHLVPGASLSTYGGSLFGVAAVASGDVWAVGEGDVGAQFRVALAEHWDGRHWQASPMPALPGQSSRLVSITAVSSRDVWAAGYYQGDSPYGLPAGPLILHWDGTRWSVVQGIATLDRLTSIAAASSRDVWAVAGDVAEHWDGTQWHTTSVPAGGLTALAVAAPDDIWGLGSQLDRYAGPLCYTAQAAPHAIPIAHTGLQNTGMAATPDAPGALVVDGAGAGLFAQCGRQ